MKNLISEEKIDGNAHILDVGLPHSYWMFDCFFYTRMTSLLNSKNNSSLKTEKEFAKISDIICSIYGRF